MLPVEVKENMTKDYVNLIVSRCDILYKGKTCHPFKLNVEIYYKAVAQGDVNKSSIAGHVLKTRDYLPL